MPRNSPAVKVVKVTVPFDNRITLYKPFCDSLPWLGKEVEAWLYLVEPGRYRLLSEEDVEKDPVLNPIRTAILQDKSTAPPHPSHAAHIRDAAMLVRLAQVRVDFHNGSSRILFPEELSALAPRDCDPRDLSILMPEGYLEIWYSDVLRRAVDRPWRSL